MAASLTFLPGFGFRPPGVRLAQEVRVKRGGRVFTIIQFVSTPSGTDLTYEITDPTQNVSCVVPGPGPSPFDPDKVTLREGDQEFGDAFVTSSGVIAGGVRRTLRARPLPTAVTKLEIHVASRLLGEWTVPLELVPFGADCVGRLHPIEASAAHEGITVHVRGISLTSEATAIRFEAIGDDPARRVLGVGGSHGMRAGANERCSATRRPDL